jgi:hypothetical protein
VQEGRISYEELYEERGVWERKKCERSVPISPPLTLSPLINSRTYFEPLVDPVQNRFARGCGKQAEPAEVQVGKCRGVEGLECQGERERKEDERVCCSPSCSWPAFRRIRTNLLLAHSRPDGEKG